MKSLVQNSASLAGIPSCEDRVAPDGIPSLRFDPPREEEQWDRQEFLGMLSHDLRTPLAGVIGFLELLAGTSLDAEQRDYLETAQNSVIFLQTILQNLLEDLRAGSLCCVIHWELCRVEDILRPLVESNRRLATDIDFRLHIAPEVSGEILADRVKLGQILTNLLDNAIKFSPGGSISVEARPSREFPGGLCVEVSDTGQGIPSGQLEKVFTAFHQARVGGVSHPGGSGLGLMIVKKLVAVLHGSLEIRSCAGCGTTVRMEFPVPTRSVPAAWAGPDSRGGETSPRGKSFPLVERRGEPS